MKKIITMAIGNPNTAVQRLLNYVFLIYEPDDHSIGYIGNVRVGVLHAEETSEALWIYVVACIKNYGHNNVFKIGTSYDVEKHLCQHLSIDAEIDKSLSFKMLMKQDEAKALKKSIKHSIVGHELQYRGNFDGKSDWYNTDVLYRTLQQFDSSLVSVNWDRFNKEYYKNRHYYIKNRKK